MTPVPRHVIGTPTPPSTRPRLQRVGVLLAHEVGVNTPTGGRYRSSAPDRVLSDARAAAAYGISATPIPKPWEYSYLIGLDGTVFEQAGEYRAAHCLNFNGESAGVIFLNATDVPANDAQIAAWHELRTFMVNARILVPDHEVAPHYRYRSTSCPGIRAQPPGGPWLSPTGQGRLGNLIPALLDPPTPTVPGVPDVFYPITPFRNSDTRPYGPPMPANKPIWCGLNAPVPADAVAVAVNVKVIQPSGPGFATVWPGGPKPSTSLLDFAAGEIVNNSTVVGVRDGGIMLEATAAAHFVVDVTGYWK